MLAAYVVIDSLRRAFLPGSRPSEPLRWIYVVPQAVYFVLMLLGQLNAVPILAVGIAVLAAPVVITQGVVYLLRVVFPKAHNSDEPTEPETP
jgi:hypothetical protein